MMETLFKKISAYYLHICGALLLVFAVLNPAFLTVTNFSNILSSASILMIIALAMTIVVASGGIDLSVGIAVDFGAAFAIIAMKLYGVEWYTACLIGIFGGALVGLLNSILIAGLGLGAFLATLSTFFVGSSIQRIFTNGGGPISYRKMPDEFHNLAVGEIFGIPTEIVIALCICFFYYLLLERSIIGKQIHAVGLQKESAITAGIQVNKLTIFIFIFAAATCAVGGLILVANMKMFTPLAGFSYLLDAIAAVFLGAALHKRGRPNFFGTFVAVIFLSLITNVINLAKLDFNVQEAVYGAILVFVLAMAVYQNKIKAKH